MPSTEQSTDHLVAIPGSDCKSRLIDESQESLYAYPKWVVPTPIEGRIEFPMQDVKCLCAQGSHIVIPVAAEGKFNAYIVEYCFGSCSNNCDEYEDPEAE